MYLLSLPVSPAPAAPNTDPMIASPAVVPRKPRLVPKNAAPADAMRGAARPPVRPIDEEK